MRWNRQDYIDLMTFNHPRQEMFCEPMGLLVGVDKEWQDSGAPGELDLTDFAFDYVPYYFVGNTGLVHAYPEITLEDTDRHLIKRDGMGRTVKLIKSSATVPLPLNFPVTDMDSWLKIKHMFTYDSSRVDEDQLSHAKKLQREGHLICAEIWGGFDLPRELLGVENCCICYYENPELMQDILNTAADCAFLTLEQISRSITIDYLSVHEDLAWKSGPMISPALVTTFIKPYYRRIWDLLKSSGTKLFAQDSDGNLNCVIDAFIDSGVNLFLPCEPAAGMDIVALRERYGKTFAMLGGIDKHVIRQGKEKIDAELNYKLQAKMLGGGMCFGLDHRIPNGTPLEDYRYYVKRAKELLGIEHHEKGWGRMAI